MAQAMLSLDRLPDDILYLILADLDTARDNASVSRTCRRLQRFMQTDGWRAFSLRYFQGLPSLESIEKRGPAPALRWDRLADSLTWQARAWDRRSLAFQALLPRNGSTNHRRRQESFRPPLAVHFQADGLGALGSVDGEEMVVWGAGEDVVARYRRRGIPSETLADDSDSDDSDPLAVARWRVLHGKAAGFRPGYDDVRSLAVVPHAMGRLRHRGILAGRDNGHLALLSAEDGSFGQTLAHFLPDKTQNVVQDRIYSLDVALTGRAFGGLDNRCGLMAATTSSHIAFYALPGEDEKTETLHIAPTAVFDMAAHGLNHNGRRMPYNVKWMAADGLAAVGLGFRTDQLCFLTARPTGFTLTATAKSRAFMQRFGLDDETLLLPSSLQPVPPTAVTGGCGSLVLSAWRDGTCRLQDVRTPSPFDLAYQDNIAPSQCFQSLLVYAPDRFLAGNQESTTLKVFDLRWPRRYHHTAGLPCGGGRPFPGGWPVKNVRSDQPPRQRCDPLTGDLCTWHANSRLLVSRPNCSIYLQRSAVSRYPDIGIWSLARAAGPDGGDLTAPNFYAGINSCIVEGFLCESRLDDSSSGSSKIKSRRSRPGDPHYSYPDVLRQRPLSLVPAPPPEQGPAAAAEWQRRQAALQRRHHYYRTVDLKWYLHEIGDGLADPDNDKWPRRLVTPLRGGRLEAPRRQVSSEQTRNDVKAGLSPVLDLPDLPDLSDLPDLPPDTVLDPHRIRRGHMPTEEADVDPILRRQHRLDSIMQRMADFTSFYEKP